MQTIHTPYDLTSPAAMNSARSAFHPQNFGFELRSDVPEPEKSMAWRKTYDNLGDVYFASVSWHHANARVPWGKDNLSMLDVVWTLQQQTWGVGLEKTTSPLDMSVIDDTGGYIGFAYRAKEGLSPEGWLAFVLGNGARSGVLASRFLAVRKEARSSGIGTDLKLMQAYAALLHDHYAMEWTFDPMRSNNANLNYNKLGARLDRYIENKYGDFNSALYGPVPSHRFFVRLIMTSPSAQAFVLKGKPLYPPIDISTVPIIDQHVSINLDNLPPQFAFPIPRYIDNYAAKHPAESLEWREQFHKICTHCLDAKIPKRHGDLPDPAMVTIHYNIGTYDVTHYVKPEKTPDLAYYIFTRKEQG